MTIVQDLRSMLGEAGVLSADEVRERAAGVWRGDKQKALALARPATTGQVSEVLRYCNQRGIAVVTHGGLTGLVHGADTMEGELVLSLERMRKIENIDPIQRTATVQAGVVLQTLQEAVAEYGLAFPLDLGARGSATLGGNASTNAGGNRVIRYGMMREMVLGVEAVLADGTIVNSLNTLIKNNAGYDLKHLFIGAEGTLGVITRLVLRLREAPTSTSMAFVGCASFDGVVKFLKHMDQGLGGALSAFEVMWQPFYALVTTPPAKGKAPIAPTHPYYVLVEAQGADPDLDRQRFELAMERAFEAGVIADAAIAQSDSDIRAFWGLRDDVGQVAVGGTPVVFDISLPIKDMERYTSDLALALPAAIGDHKLWIFGHLGDGNLHVIVQVARENYVKLRPQIETLVYTPLQKLGGSVSAEHGVGLEKKPYLNLSRNEPELALMRTLKHALDPKGILNPGKIF